MSEKETTREEEQTVLEVLNSTPEPCCGNTDFETDVAENISIHEAVQDFYAQRALSSDS